VPSRPLLSNRRQGRVDIAMVGRIVRAKGQDIVIEALACLEKKQQQQLTLRIAGNVLFSDAAYLVELQEQIDNHGLTDSVHLIGELDDDELWSLYECSHILLSASLHEGLCVPVIEAYLAGCRVIGTTAGNLPYVVIPPDPIVPVRDVDALAGALRRIIAETLSAPFEGNPNGLASVHKYGLRAAQVALISALDAAIR
jgi:glycosyltransferase involved in cell wall biosynthesis